jgi:hypothetical protein
MQTFMPFPDFQASADVLDPIRRWKQVVECHQIIDGIIWNPSVWDTIAPRVLNHPVMSMWMDYLPALLLYTNHMLCTVIRLKTHKVVAYQPFDMIGDLRNPKMPWWVGNKEFHASHRSNLLRKDPVFYGKYGWTERSDLPYVWPTRAKRADRTGRLQPRSK